MQQPMQNPEDISDPTTTLDMVLELMSKASQLNNITPTNNNQRSSSNPCYSQIAQSGMNIDQDRQMLMVDNNVGNQFRENAVQNVGHLVGQNARRGSLCQQLHSKAKEKGCCLSSDKALVYDSDGSAEVHHSKNCYDNDIFNMFTQEEQYTKLLEPIPEPHQVQQNDSNVISAVSSVEHSRGTVEQHPANVEETCILYDSLYNNLAIEVEKVNSVNRKLKETNVNLTTELARYKNQEKCFEISQEKYDKLERCYQKSVYQEQCLTEKIYALHLSFGKQIMTLNKEISNLNKQLSKEKSIVSSLLKEKKKLKSDFKIHEDELLDKQIQIENKIKELDNILVKTGQSIQTMHMLSPKLNLFYHTEQKMALGYQNPFYLKQAQQKQQYTLDPLPQKLEIENIELEYQVLSYEKENAHLKTAYKNLFDSINVTRAQTKTIIDSLQDKLHNTIYENAKLRDQLFDRTSEQKDTTKGMSVNTQFRKQSILGKPPSSSGSKLYSVTPLPKSKVFPKVSESNALSKPVTSNSAPSSRESTIVNNERVISLGIFRINPFKASRVDNFVPNKHVKASIRTKPVTVSQPYVITKNDVNSKTNGFSPKDVKSATRTRRPQPRNNPKCNKVPFKSKSSCLSNKLEKIEENHRSLQSSNYSDHTSSECNNIKLAIQNEKYEVICATCKQCLITSNHDEFVLQYVNGIKSRKKNQSANVSKSANQKKHKPRVWKPKKVGSKEKLASPKPSTPRSCLRWSPTGRIFDLTGKIIATSESEFQFDCIKGDNACTSNPQEPISKQFPSLTLYDMLSKLA
ncbi:hypothetical protein Tco_1070283 [Tanacetum coccineum]|uniref:Uncharacterized protein n=1 Tax=Tanacetum coccineum TaxID=301880 RepID=A0ABQ5HKY8_9ASTR